MLLNTTVQRWDGARCYYPNVMLNANPLINLTRSENKGDVVKVRAPTFGARLAPL